MVSTLELGGAEVRVRSGRERRRGHGELEMRGSLFHFVRWGLIGLV
jgi:hypothetical protein